MNGFDCLAGEKIVLRKAREEDCRSMMVNVWSDEEVWKQMLFQPTWTEEEAVERCGRSIAYQRDHLAWFVALKDTDEAIGMCAMRDNGQGHFEESGICIGQKYWGNGYGREVVAILLRLAFDSLGAVDFRYGYVQDNERSKRLATRFGFVYDRTETIIRPWDGAAKTIDSCLLTRERYRSQSK